MKKLLILFLGLVFCSQVFADRLSLYIQNDVFLPNNSDKYYTHGTRIEYSQTNIGYSIGQYMYTPSDITKTEILEGDRPYCGWLYGSVFKEFFHKDGIIDYLELQIGTVGKYSFAEGTQKFVHKTIGSRKPMGWTNQISDELCANLFWSERYPIEIVPETFYFDPQFGAAIGNYYTGAHVGYCLRLGYNVPKSDLPKSLEPSILSKKKALEYIYVFGKMNGRYVAHNITIEGSLFSNDSPHVVEPERFVLDVEYGICARIYGFEASISVVDRSDEFVEQEYDEEFAAITLSWFF